MPRPKYRTDRRVDRYIKSLPAATRCEVTKWRVTRSRTDHRDGCSALHIPDSCESVMPGIDLIFRT
jgi:hypothetical protein